MTQLRHNKKTMNGCAIDPKIVKEKIPQFGDVLAGMVEDLREAYISLGSSVISSNPQFVIKTKDGVLRKIDGDNYLPTRSIEKASRFDCSVEKEIMSQLGDGFEAVSTTIASEFLLIELTKKIYEWLEMICQSNNIDVNDIRDIQSSSYFGWEMPELMSL